MVRGVRSARGATMSALRDLRRHSGWDTKKMQDGPNAPQDSMAAGAVAALGAVRAAITAARLVLRHTTHSLLVGAAADDFAVSMGLPRHNLTTAHSAAAAATWYNFQRPPGQCIDV